VCVCVCVEGGAQMRNDRSAICLRRTARKSEGEMCLSTFIVAILLFNIFVNSPDDGLI
jgi:hypothetical protein